MLQSEKNKMRRKIKVNGVDYFAPEGQLSIPRFSTLSNNYEVEISDSPDFLFYSCVGTKFLKYTNCVRIFYTKENVRPDFNQCDYAIGFDRMQFGDRYCRWPLNISPLPFDKDIHNESRKFCNFIYSNISSGKGAKERINFCKFLAKYKKIDCPGAAMNNMKAAITPREGDWHQGKIDFIKNYKFTIAWENTYYAGYVTEKLVDPLNARSIPIYMGDPDIAIDLTVSTK